jgi:hypothetical protein
LERVSLCSDSGPHQLFSKPTTPTAPTTGLTPASAISSYTLERVSLCLELFSKPTTPTAPTTGLTPASAMPTTLGTGQPVFRLWSPSTVQQANNSNGTNNGSDACFCNANYTWISPIQLCALNCSSLNNTNGNSGINSCFCIDNYDWNGTDCDVIPIDCSLYINSNGTNNGSDACFCSPGYDWDRSVQLCILNCSNLSNTAGNNGPNACFCVDNYEWNGTACVQTVVPINCSAVNNSNGTNNGIDSCYCVSGFFFDETVDLCILNCSSFPNTAGNNGID